MRSFFKLSAFLIFALSCLDISAEVTYFSWKFDADAEDPLDGWSCHGQGKTAKSSPLGSTLEYIISYFPEGSKSYKVISFDGVEDAAYSNSTTVEGGKVEEWLVSPKISVPEGIESMILQYEEFAIGSIRPGDYDVCISVGGSEPDDFAKILYSGRPKGSNKEVVANTVIIPINGYNGKDIRIAFVNRSNGTAFLGFAGISLKDYFVSVNSLIPEFVFNEGECDAVFDVSICTPTPCNGFTARFHADNEPVQEFSIDSDISKLYHNEIRFKSGIKSVFDKKINYSLEVIPADQSLESLLYNGSITCAEGFPGVCVMEEATGSWCPSCVRGAAAIAKFSDDYPGQFFGLAVHSKDPMTVDKYETALSKDGRISSYPSAWLNRTTLEDPQSKSSVSRFVNEKLPSKVEIDKVSLFSQEGTDKITVYFSPQLCYDSNNANLRAVAVISEDHCKGSSTDWAQQNGYSGHTPEQVGGDEWWPYFEFYSNEGKIIVPSKMEYNHVAWGIYNDYAGTDSNIATQWKAYEPQQYSITFDVPYQLDDDGAGVQNIKNTAITVILLDGETGRIIGADRMDAKEFLGISPSGAETLETDKFNAYRMGSSIAIEGSRSAKIEIYDIAGKLIAKQSAPDGNCIIHTSTQNNAIIVRIVSGPSTHIIKLL